MPKLTKIRSGLYRTEYAGHVIELERIDEGPAGDIGMWTFHIDPQKVGTHPAEPRWTRREALDVALQTLNAPRTLLEVLADDWPSPGACPPSWPA